MFQEVPQSPCPLSLMWGGCWITAPSLAGALRGCFAVFSRTRISMYQCPLGATCLHTPSLTLSFSFLCQMLHLKKVFFKMFSVSDFLKKNNNKTPHRVFLAPGRVWGYSPCPGRPQHGDVSPRLPVTGRAGIWAPSLQSSILMLQPPHVGAGAETSKDGKAVVTCVSQWPVPRSAACPARPLGLLTPTPSWQGSAVLQRLRDMLLCHLSPTITECWKGS